MLYVKMLPRDPQAGRTSRDYTIMNPDTGEDVKFVAGDQEWSKVSDEFGEALRKVRQHFYRIHSPNLFLVVTEEEADRLDREDTVQRQYRSRKTRPRRSLAKDLTQPQGELSLADRMSDAPGEPDADLSEIEQLHETVAAQSNQIDKLTALVEGLLSSQQPSPATPQSHYTAPPSAVEVTDLPDAEPSSRAAALDLDGPSPERVPDPFDDLSVIKGIGDSTAAALLNAGIRTFDDLTQADAADLDDALKIKSVTPEKIQGWQAQAETLIKR